MISDNTAAHGTRHCFAGVFGKIVTLRVKQRITKIATAGAIDRIVRAVSKRRLLKFSPRQISHRAHGIRLLHHLLFVIAKK